MSRSTPDTTSVPTPPERPAGVRPVGRSALLRRVARPEPWRRGRVLAAASLLLGLLMLLHGWIPDGFGNPGSLVETFLPWFGLLVLPLLAAALWRRSALALVALLAPVTVWLSLFVPVLADKSQLGGELTVVSQNVDAGNPDPAGTARDLAASGAQLLALEELTPQATGVYEQGLASAYPYHVVLGTVGLWSRLPLADTQPIDIVDHGPLAATKSAAAKLLPNRALRATVTTPHGALTVYVAHLGSVRVVPRGGFWTSSRDLGLQALGRALAVDPSPRVLLLGDLNGTTADRDLAVLTSRLHSAQDTAGAGFGFTWPASFPVVRIDQILLRGLPARRSWVLPANTSDHLPVAAALAW